MLADARLTRSQQEFYVSEYPSATTLRPSALTFLAAFQSLRWWVQHPGQAHSRSESDVVVLIAAGGTELGRRKEPVHLNKVLRFHRALYSTWRSSSPNAASSHDFACLVLASAFRLKCSKQMTDHVMTI